MRNEETQHLGPVKLLICCCKVLGEKFTAEEFTTWKIKNNGITYKCAYKIVCDQALFIC